MGDVPETNTSELLAKSRAALKAFDESHADQPQTFVPPHCVEEWFHDVAGYADAIKVMNPDLEATTRHDVLELLAVSKSLKEAHCHAARRRGDTISQVVLWLGGMVRSKEIAEKSIRRRAAADVKYALESLDRLATSMERRHGPEKGAYVDGINFARKEAAKMLRSELASLKGTWLRDYLKEPDEPAAREPRKQRRTHPRKEGKD